MLHHQKRAYIRLWISILLILATLSAIVWLLIDPNAERILDILFPIFLYGILGTIIIAMISLILLQIIGGYLLDYYMAQRLEEPDFLYYHTRRTVNRDDYIVLLYEKNQSNNPQQHKYVQIILNDVLSRHKVLRWYYHHFLEEKFVC